MAKDITDHSDWTEGDFALISADNVRFKVPSLQLMSASAVFADMLQLEPALEDKSIHLVDPVLETESVLRSFLHLSKHWRLSSDVMWQLDKLVLFLKKYDCRGPMAVLASEIVKSIDKDNYFKIFWAVGQLNDLGSAMSLCRTILLMKDSSQFLVGDMVKHLGIEELLRLPPKFYQSVIASLIDSVEKCDRTGGWAPLLRRLESTREAFTLTTSCPRWRIAGRK